VKRRKPQSRRSSEYRPTISAIVADRQHVIAALDLMRNPARLRPCELRGLTDTAGATRTAEPPRETAEAERRISDGVVLSTSPADLGPALAGVHLAAVRELGADIYVRRRQQYARGLKRIG
jgi:hypothetical protein